MGTNFFWSELCGKNISDNEDIHIHIGKRSAAGLYCWDCGTTLCLDGTRYIHYSKKEPFHEDVKWSNICPSCGLCYNKPLTIQDNIPNAIKAELGFSTLKKEQLSGITSCSSFMWTLMSHKWKLQSLLFSGEKVVVDEYGQLFTAKEFLEDQLALVAIESQHPYIFI